MFALPTICFAYFGSSLYRKGSKKAAQKKRDGSNTGSSNRRSQREQVPEQRYPGGREQGPLSPPTT